MADKPLAGAQADHVLRLFHDNGDGTFAEVIYTGGGAVTAVQLPATLGQKAAAASLSVVQASDQIGPGVDVTATGALGASGNAVTINTKGLATVVTEVDTGNLVGTVSYEATEDDTNWISVFGFSVVINGNWGATDAAYPARRIFAVGGFSQFRARVSAYTSGTSNARLRGSVAPQSVRVTPGSLFGVGNGADGSSNSNGGFLLSANAGSLSLNTWPLDFNGTTWDRHRNNVAVVSLASGSRTTTQTGADIVTYNARSLKVILDMTTVGTGSVTLTIQGKSATGIYYTLLAGAAVVTNVTNVYDIGPGLPATANVSANLVLPRTIRLVVTANNANAAVYSLDYELSV